MDALPATALLASPGPVVLDGGLATELERRGHDLSGDLWSARLLRDDPGAIEDVHLAYYRAGAQVATTASYQGSFEGFLRLSVELAGRARQARVAEIEAAGEPAPALYVAASVGPYGLSFSCRDGAHTCEGQPIEKAVAVTARSEQVIAVGVNCTAPAFVERLLARARSATGLPLVAYPNDGRLGLGPHGFPADAVERWHELGAQLVGGCCGIGPDAIRSLAQVAAGRR